MARDASSGRRDQCTLNTAARAGSIYLADSQPGPQGSGERGFHADRHRAQCTRHRAVLLGVLVSWGGTWLWNEASSRLTTTLAGLLIVTETIAGYTYAYIVEARFPPPTELVGFALVIIGVVLVTRLRTCVPVSAKR